MGRSDVIVHAPDVESLQRLLVVCSDAGVDVLAVLSRQSDLESLFLAALGIDDAAVVEPAPATAQVADPRGRERIPSGDLPGGQA